MGTQEGLPSDFLEWKSPPLCLAYMLYYFSSFLLPTIPRPRSPSQLSSCCLFLTFLTSNILYSITLLACLITWSSLATLLWSLPVLPLGGRELASWVSHHTSRWVRINSAFEQTFEQWYLPKESFRAMERVLINEMNVNNRHWTVKSWHDNIPL